MKRIFRKEYLPFYTFAIIIVFYHLLIVESYGDALTYFSKVLDTTSLPAYLSMRYTQWTSRLIVESVLVYVARSQIAWKILDCCMWMLLVVSTSYLMPQKNVVRNRWIAVALWLLIPFWEMSSAGWIATTVNYSWPLALGAFSMTIIARAFRGQPIRWHHALCSLLALLYAANVEQMCILLLAVFGTTLLVQLRTRRASGKVTAWLSIHFAIILAELVFILTCPGNQYRTLAETQTWNPSFAQLQLGQKLQLGIVDTLYVLQSSWIVLYGLLCFLLLFLAWRQRKTQPLTLLAACIPFGSACIYSVLGFRRYGLHVFMRFITAENQAYELSFFALIQSLIVLGCLCFVLFQLYRTDKQTGCLMVGVLLLGGATRAVLGFSPTLYVSSGRTFLFLYACVVWIDAMLIQNMLCSLQQKNRRIAITAVALLVGFFVLTTTYVLLRMA